MTDFAKDIILDQLLAVLREGIEGPPKRWSYFTDSGPEAGLLGTLGKVDAAAASRPVGGSTIAAHVHHLVFGLEVSAAWIRGERRQWNWPESWSVSTVDAAEWACLVAQLRDHYQELRQEVAAHATDGAEAFGGAVGVVAHVAYHLGAVRQKVLVGRQG
jgi:hypothetical protein